jgi:2-polyprenyl-6-methoxyphenol hydroxylase-like FAD-dependent oxidoreductase
MRHVERVLVVRGGGMCVAICLARQGIAVDLVEVRRDRNMRGAGLTLNGASPAAFCRVGVRIAAEGALRKPHPGSVSIGPQSGGILRPVLHRILAEAMEARGVAVDYAIILFGEMYTVMEDGETLMKAGDVLVQRGTNHAWSNRSGEICRVAFIVVDGRSD